MEKQQVPLLRRQGLWLLAGLGLLCLGFFAGRLSTSSASSLHHIQAQPNDPRELLPLPGLPNDGQGGQPMPGEGECPIYLYQDGELYQFQPGTPLPGQNGSPELFPLEPAPRFPIPPQQVPPMFEEEDLALNPQFIPITLQ